MALEGRLREFSATEILQLVASQRKTGVLVVEHETQRRSVFVIEGRIVSTRPAGVPLAADPLVAFMRRIRRLSEDQIRGLTTLQSESLRDLEPLLLEGCYVTAQELAALVERLILEDLTELVEWTDGSYRFDSDARPKAEPLVRLSTEASLIEAARRADERQRFRELFGDGARIVRVRDLPDPEEQISEEESELFGIIDGVRTVSEVVAAAPLSDYEGSEALQRMIEAGWVEFLGRRETPAEATTPDVTAPAAPAGASRRPAPGPSPLFGLARELLVATVCCAALEAFVLVAHNVRPAEAHRPETSVFALADLRDVRQALELYRREDGHYPQTLGDLVKDRWLDPHQLVVEGRALVYHAQQDRDDYTLELAP